MARSDILFVPVVNTARCTGCGWCVAACPLNLLSLESANWRKHAVVHDVDRCTGCRKCEVACPFSVIAIVREPAPVQACVVRQR